MVAILILLMTTPCPAVGELDRFLTDEVGGLLELEGDLNLSAPKKRPGKAPPATERPFTALLKKGSVITEIATKKEYRTGRDLIVRARAIAPEHFRSSILTKDRKAKYNTASANLETLDALLPENKMVSVEDDPLAEKIKLDQSVRLENDFLLGRELISTPRTAALFGGSKTAADALIAQWRMRYKTGFPLNADLRLGFTEGAWTDPNIGTAVWRAFNIGVGARYKWSKWNISLGWQQSLHHTIAGRPLSSESWQADISRDLSLFSWNILLGMGHRVETASLKTPGIHVPRLQDKALALFIGYRNDWRLW